MIKRLLFRMNINNLLFRIIINNFVKMDKMKEDKFIARYEKDGIKKSVIFSRAEFTKKKAQKWLNKNNIKNFLFFFEPQPPTPFKENGMMFQGEVGFDITTSTLLPHIEAGKDIYLDTFGGDSWEGLKIHDAIKALGTNPRIEAMGTVASAGIQILISTDNRFMSPNSRLLIHNPWTIAMGDDSEFKQIANELEAEKLQIAKLYTNISGKSIDEILNIMKPERFMFLEEAIELRFVKAKTEGKEKTEVKTNKKDEMEITKEEKKEFNGLKNMIKGIANLLNPVKNVIIQDVNGVELDFTELETSDQISIGSKATVDGSPASGDFVLEDGTTYKFESGELMEIILPDDETENTEVADLQAENEALKSENETLKVDVENKIKISNDLKVKFTKDLETITNKLNDFESKFSEEKPKPNTPATEKVKGNGKFSYTSKK